MRRERLSTDETLRPIALTCGKCGKEAIAYPLPGHGMVYCPCTTPAWAQDFALYCTNAKRAELGLGPIETNP